MRVWNSDQSWHSHDVVKKGGHTLRVRIRRNAYDWKSWLRVDRWDGSKWQEVLRLPMTPEWETFRSSYVDWDGATFTNRALRDGRTLAAEAMEVLS